MFSEAMNLDIAIKGVHCICLITGCLLLSEGTLLVYHESPASWSDAHKICEESYGTLMTSYFLAFDEVRKDGGLLSSEAVWTNFYWRDTGFENILLDTNCQGGMVFDLNETALDDTQSASHGCVLANFTASPVLVAAHCDVPLPFACQVDSVLQSSTFSQRYYFNDYQIVSNIDIATCRSRCLGNTALPCRSVIFNTQSCTMLPNKESLDSATAQWNVNWENDITMFYQRESYADVVSTVSKGNILPLLDPPDVVTGTTAASCEIYCAWSNNRCACADFENGRCRLFTSAVGCNVLSLVPASFPGALSVFKTTGSYTALYVNTDVHVASASPDPPPQLQCVVPSPVISSTPYLEVTSDVADSSITASKVETEATAWLTSVVNTLQTSVEEVSTVNVDVSSAGSNDFSTISAIAPSIADLPQRTYFIWQSGDPASSEFECDVVSATPVVSDVTEVTTFECTFLSVYSRDLADNDTSFIEKVVEKLAIDKTETSSYKRKYASAHDSRPSARNVGIVGIVMLAVVFGGLILLDMSTLKRDIRVLLSNIRRK